MLFEDRFEYYTTYSDFKEGSKPRCRVSINDVDDLVVFPGEGWDMLTGHGKLQLRAIGPTDFKRWEEAWGEVFTLESDEDGER